MVFDFCGFVMVNFYARVVYICIACCAVCGCASQTMNSLHDSNRHINLAMAYLQQGNFTKARMAINQAFIENPNSSLNWDALAYLEELSGNIQMAEQEYLKAIRLQPHQGEPYNNYGVFLCRHSRQQEGIDQLLIAVQISSYVDRGEAYENAGHCAESIPDQQAAQQYFAAAVRNNPH